jgi:hypothetical protein
MMRESAPSDFGNATLDAAVEAWCEALGLIGIEAEQRKRYRIAMARAISAARDAEARLLPSQPQFEVQNVPARQKRA